MTNTEIARRYAIAALCGLSALPAAAQDPRRGQQVYELHCLTCHYESIHKRDPARSIIRSFTELRVEVANRAALTKQRFAVEDLDDIAEYLNRSHYRFKK